MDMDVLPVSDDQIQSAKGHVTIKFANHYSSQVYVTGWFCFMNFVNFERESLNHLKKSSIHCSFSVCKNFDDKWKYAYGYDKNNNKKLSSYN